MKNLLATSVLSILMLAGCATQGKNTANFTLSTPTTVNNEMVVSQPYSQVWDKLVKELSKSYYVINNIDKESRIINLSFSSASPQEYVDCGSSARTYTQGDHTNSFKYDIASSSRYKMATPRQPSPSFYYYADVIRTTSLEGRSNIYLAPDEADKTKTRVAVNTRYILSIAIRGQVFQENFQGSIISSSPLPMEPPTTIAFNTNKPVQHDWGGGVSSSCFGNGKLEKEILGLLQN